MSSWAKQSGVKADLDLIRLRDPLCDANNQADLVVNGLYDCIRCIRRRDIENAGVRLGVSDRLAME